MLQKLSHYAGDDHVNTAAPALPGPAWMSLFTHRFPFTLCFCQKTGQ